MRIGFVGLMIWGSVVAATGLFALVIAIPWGASKSRSWYESEAKTEFHAVRASYWCILCGTRSVAGWGHWRNGSSSDHANKGVVMGFLPKSEIKRRQAQDRILGKDYDDTLVKQASYDRVFHP